MKKYVPQIRVISVEHDLTVQATQRLAHAMRQAGLTYPVREVFCHLEAGRCGLKAGVVGIEVDGSFVWGGKELTESLAVSFCDGLKRHVERMEQGEL